MRRAPSRDTCGCLATAITPRRLTITSRLKFTANPPNKWWVAAALLATAAAFRLPLLDRRPMHADEAIQADKFGTLLGTGHYPYDPREYHGPVLSYLAWIPARLTGRTSYQTLTETMVRLA